MGGLYASAPLLAALFLVPAFSLAGFPPLSGFWAKYLLVKASLDVGAWVLAGVALVVGLLTIYSMTKIWGAVFWTPHPEGREPSLKQLDPGTRAAYIVLHRRACGADGADRPRAAAAPDLLGDCGAAASRSGRLY